MKDSLRLNLHYLILLRTVLIPRLYKVLGDNVDMKVECSMVRLGGGFRMLVAMSSKDATWNVEYHY